MYVPKTTIGAILLLQSFRSRWFVVAPRIDLYCSTRYYIVQVTIFHGACVCVRGRGREGESETAWV